MIFRNPIQIRLIFFIVSVCILLLPLRLWAQTAGEGLIVMVTHDSAGDNRNVKIEDIMNRVAVMRLEQAGLKAVVLQESQEELSAELKITCRYLEQQDTLKLEYQLKVASTGKRVAEIRITTPVNHFLDRVVADAVDELLHTGRDEIKRIALAKLKWAMQEPAKQEGMTSVVVEETDRETELEEKSEPEPEDMPKAAQLRGTEHQRRRIETESKVSGAYMLGPVSEHLPYGLLMEGRFSYPVVRGEKMAWRVGGSLGVIHFASAVSYKAGYVKILVPLGLLTEVKLRKKSGWTFNIWWAVGAALRPTHENEMVDKLLAPAFPYTNMGIGVQVPFNSDRLGVSAGFSGMGLFYLYEDTAVGEVKTEILLGLNFDLGIVWRM